MAVEDLHEVDAYENSQEFLVNDIIWRCYNQNPFTTRIDERILWDVMDDFPGNQRNAEGPKAKSKAGPGTGPKKTDPPEREEVDKVVTGTVVEKKKGFGVRMKKVFFGGEAKSTGQYVVSDIVIPMIRDLVVNAVIGGVESAVYGERSSPQFRGGPVGRGKVTYGGPSASMGPRQRGLLPGQGPRRTRSDESDENDHYLNTAEDAQAVIDRMVFIMQKYEYATRKDLKRMLGLPTSWVDEEWGWWDVNRIGMQQTRDGWKILLPEAEPI